MRYKLPYARVIAFATVLGLFAVGLCVIAITLSCNSRNLPPSGLVYPESTMQDQSMFGIGTTLYPVAEIQYTTVASAETVAQFYESKGNCQRQDSHVQCHIQLNDSQETLQLVSIDLGSASPTRYRVQLRWHGCSYSWSE